MIVTHAYARGDSIGGEQAAIILASLITRGSMGELVNLYAGPGVRSAVADLESREQAAL
jgi:hypothetical protein